MPEVAETVVADPSSGIAEVPAKPEIDPLQEGPMVGWTRQQRNEFRNTGKMPESKPKADPAPAGKPSEASAESAADSETAQQQEHTEPHAASKPKQTAEERIAQLEATIEKIRKGAGLERTAKPESSPTETKPQNQPQPPKTYQEWRTKAFNASKWVEEYVKANPETSYEEANAAMSDFLAEVRDGFRQRNAQEEAYNRDLKAKLDEAKGRYENFDEVMWPTLKEINGDTSIHQSVKDMLSESEILPHVLYVIGNKASDKAEFYQMARSSPAKAKRYLASVEQLIYQELEGQKPLVEAAPVKPKTSAPKPPAEVGGRANAPGDTLVAAAAANDFRSFKAEINRRALAGRKTG